MPQSFISPTAVSMTSVMRPDAALFSNKVSRSAQASIASVIKMRRPPSVSRLPACPP